MSAVRKQIAIILVCILGIVVLFLVNPENTVWFPKCMFYHLTGLQCPACGTQRAIHQLMHLHFASAFRYNPFLLISLPYLLALFTVKCFAPENKLQRLRNFCHHSTTVIVYLILIILWWGIRNII
jgi:hypothetical protein